MVDSNDRDRVDAARDELHRMLNEDELRESILLVFANKQVSLRLFDPLLVLVREGRVSGLVARHAHGVWTFVSSCHCKRRHVVV